jgi:pectate lyase
MGRILLVTLGFVLFVPAVALGQRLPAFPGAEGFGSQSVGGRGGQVFEVTNLDDSGPGSLREALEASGPRTVVFRVAGTIELDSSIKVENPYLTIAGQTAPGGGITLKNSPLNAKTPLKIKAHDVIIRHIRSRPGSNPNENGTLDAITISHEHGDVYNVIVDHSSFSWATDEVANIYYAAYNITVQWSIFSEGLYCSTHIEDGETQCHSMGMLIGHENGGEYSIHHNLFAHNKRRNPRIKTTGVVDVVNNVVYNSGTGKNSRSAMYVNGEFGVNPANIVANYFKPGETSGEAEWVVDTKSDTAVFLEGNRAPNLVMNPSEHDQKNLVEHRHPSAPVSTTVAEHAFDQVLADAGATIGLDCDGTAFWRRDPVDTRVVNDVRNGTGAIIDEPEDVGGWPVLAAGVACPDGDHDGMPDEWETLNGLDPTDGSDGSEYAPSGYTWLETYLNPSVGLSCQSPCVAGE